MTKFEDNLLSQIQNQEAIILTLKSRCEPYLILQFGLSVGLSHTLESRTRRPLFLSSNLGVNLTLLYGLFCL